MAFRWPPTAPRRLLSTRGTITTTTLLRTSTATTTPLALYEERLARGLISADPHQRAIVAGPLMTLYGRLQGYRPPHSEDVKASVFGGIAARLRGIIVC